MSVVYKSAFSNDESIKRAMTPVLNCMKFQFTISVDFCGFWGGGRGCFREQNAVYSLIIFGFLSDLF